MNYTTQTILPETIHGQASGNYDGSSQDFFSDPQIAANYYGGQGSIQTVTFQVTAFQGLIRLEGTLADSQAVNEGLAQWFQVYDYDARFVARTDFHPESIIGNFSYMRVNVLEFDAGTINSVTIAY